MGEPYISERFVFTTGSIDIKKLERESRRLLYLGFVVSVAFHAMLAALFTYKRTEVTVVKPIEVELIVRPPRMTRPFMIDKKGIVRRMLLRRRFITRLPTGKFQFRSPVSLETLFTIVDSFAPYLNIDRETIAEVVAEIDSTMYAEIRGRFDPDYMKAAESGFRDFITREPEGAFSFRNELLRIEDLDIGDTRALVIKDPQDKRNIRGFVYIPVDTWGTILQPAEPAKAAIMGLAAGFEKYTGIKINTDRHVFLDSPEINEYPFLYISADQLAEFTENEVRRFRDYIAGGGFVLVEGYGKGYMPLRQLIFDALGDSALYPVPVDHPVFHTFFDFDVEPERFPRTDEGEDITDLFPLQGIWFDDRLAGVFSGYGMGAIWAAYEFENPFFRLGVNMVVLSLIHEGSVARKYINVDSEYESGRMNAP